MPPPGAITGEKEQSLGRRSQAVALCKPKWGQSGERQMLLATGSSCSIGSRLSAL